MHRFSRTDGGKVRTTRGYTVIALLIPLLLLCGCNALYRDLARESQRAGDYAGAISYHTRIIDSLKGSTDGSDEALLKHSYYDRGLAYIEIGDWPNALNDFTSLLGYQYLFQKRVWGLERRAFVLSQLAAATFTEAKRRAYLEQASSDLTSLIAEIEGQNWYMVGGGHIQAPAAYLVQRGSVQEKLGNLDSAIEDYETASRSRPSLDDLPDTLSAAPEVDRNARQQWQAAVNRSQADVKKGLGKLAACLERRGFLRLKENASEPNALADLVKSCSLPAGKGRKGQIESSLYRWYHDQLEPKLGSVDLGPALQVVANLRREPTFAKTWNRLGTELAEAALTHAQLQAVDGKTDVVLSQYRLVENIDAKHTASFLRETKIREIVISELQKQLADGTLSLDVAWSDFHRLQALYPQSAPELGAPLQASLLSRGHEHLRATNWTGAITCLDRASKIRGGLAVGDARALSNALSERGMFHLREQDYQDAVRDLKAALGWDSTRSRELTPLIVVANEALATERRIAREEERVRQEERKLARDEARRAEERRVQAITDEINRLSQPQADVPSRKLNPGMAAAAGALDRVIRNNPDPATQIHNNISAMQKAQREGQARKRREQDSSEHERTAARQRIARERQQEADRVERRLAELLADAQRAKPQPGSGAIDAGGKARSTVRETKAPVPFSVGSHNAPAVKTWTVWRQVPGYSDIEYRFARWSKTPVDGKHQWWVQLRSSVYDWDVGVGVHPSGGPVPESPITDSYRPSPKKKHDGIYHFVDAKASTIAIYMSPVRRDE